MQFTLKFLVERFSAKHLLMYFACFSFPYIKETRPKIDSINSEVMPLCDHLNV
jgi:hypothetical protein